MGSTRMEVQELTADVIKNQDAIGKKRKEGEGRRGRKEGSALLLPSFPHIYTGTNKADLAGKAAPQLEEV